MVDRWCLWAMIWPRYVQQNMHARNDHPARYCYHCSSDPTALHILTPIMILRRSYLTS